MRRRLAWVFLFFASPALATAVSGPAKILDGDTLEIAGERIRLFGVDAPEATQTCDRDGQTWACGRTSAERLRGLIGNSGVTCDGNERDQYCRLVAVCTVAGVDLNQAMVADGWAVAFRRYSEAYVADEARAICFFAETDIQPPNCPDSSILKSGIVSFGQEGGNVDVIDGAREG